MTRGTLLGNGPMIGASIMPVCIMATWGASMWVNHVADPVAWGLLISTYIFVSVSTMICAEIADAIRGGRP